MSNSVKTASPPVYLTVRPCPHCGATHLGLPFQEMPKPDARGNTHRGFCAVNGEPLSARYTPPSPLPVKKKS
jgi:hypothetical protein